MTGASEIVEREVESKERECIENRERERDGFTNGREVERELEGSREGREENKKRVKKRQKFRIFNF
jgi:hypothetical protein